MPRLGPAVIGRGRVLMRATPSSRVPRRVAVASGLLLVCGCLFGSASAAGATYTWVGEGTKPEWSNPANWSNAGQPLAESSVETLAFPRLHPLDCYEQPPLLTCFASENDLHGLSVGEIQLDDADEYVLSGDELTLGAGGILAEGPAGSGGFANLKLPLDLGASQKWNISGGPIGGNGVAVGSEVSGSGSALTVALNHRGSVYFLRGAHVETGNVLIESSDATRGFVGLTEGTINRNDGHSLTLRGVALEAFDGATGGLVLENPITLVGAFEYDEETGTEAGLSGTLATQSASIGAGTLILPITGTAGYPGHDFSQLTSFGGVTINGGLLDISDESEAGCPSVPAGQVDTLISTTGGLNGSFSNAPEGSTLTTTCLSPSLENISGESFRINYHRGGSPATVTATAIGGGQGNVGTSQEQRERELREHVAILQQERLVRERATKERELARESRERAAEAQTIQAITVGLDGIVPTGKAAKIAVLLKKGFSLAFTTPAAGTLTISWYEVPHGAHLSSKPKPVLVATGSTTFVGAGSKHVLVRLTVAGKRLLRHAKRISLTAKGSFTRAGKPPVVKRENFVLKR